MILKLRGIPTKVAWCEEVIISKEIRKIQGFGQLTSEDLI